eukprot:Opistho-1_new@82136
MAFPSYRLERRAVQRRLRDSAVDEHGPLDDDRRRRHAAGVGDHFDAGGARRGEGARVGGVEVGGDRHAGAIAALHDERHHRTAAGRHDVGELGEMARAASGDAVGKLGEAGGAAEVDVLDLDVGGRTVVVLQHEVDAARLAVADFAAEAVVAGEFGDGTGGDRSGEHRVRPVGVDADQRAVRLDDLERHRELAGEVRRHRHEGTGSCRVEAEHRTGIRTVHDLDAAVRERHVGEEALVAADEAAFEKRRRELHQGASRQARGPGTTSQVATVRPVSSIIRPLQPPAVRSSSMKPNSCSCRPAATVRPAACIPAISFGSGRSSSVPLLPTTSWPAPPLVKVRLSNRWTWPESTMPRSSGRRSPAAAAYVWLEPKMRWCDPRDSDQAGL